MKTLVLYDSQYGNTQKVAQAIRDAVPGKAELRHMADVEAAALETCDLLFIGSPTQAASYTKGMKAFLEQIDPSALKGRKVATFDTRFPVEAFPNKFLGRLAHLMGFAAPKLARNLKRGGAVILGKPGDFFVTTVEGPLKEGELERARAWAADIAARAAGER